MKFEMPKFNVLTFDLSTNIAAMQEEETIIKGNKNDSSVF